MKRFQNVIIMSILFFCMLIAALPSILSTNLIGKPVVTYLAKRCIPCEECSYDALKTGWLSSTTITGLQIKLQKADTATISLRECHIEKSLLQLLFHSKQLGKIEVIEPKMVRTLSKIFGNVQAMTKALPKQTIAPLPYLSEPIQEGSLQGHILVRNSSFELKDAKGQLLVKVQSPHTECLGALDRIGPLAISSTATIWDGLSGSLGTLDAACQVRQNLALSGDLSLQIPSLSLKVLGAEMVDLLGEKASLLFRVQENIASLDAKIQNVEIALHGALKGSHIELEPGTLVRASLSSELYSQLLSFYKVQTPYRLLQPLPLEISLPKRSSIDWRALNTQHLELAIRSNDTLWTTGTSPFYSQFSGLVMLEGTKLSTDLMATLKSEISSSLKTELNVGLVLSDIEKKPLPFSFITKLSGGFFTTLLPESCRVAKTPEIDCTFSSEGFLGDTVECTGKIALNSSFGKGQAEFQVTPTSIAIGSASSDITIEPSSLFSTLTGSPISCVFHAEDITLPRSTSLLDWMNDTHISSKILVQIPSLAYEGVPMIQDFSLTGSIDKEKGSDTVTACVDQQSIVADNILSFVPTKSSLQSLYHMKTGVFSLTSLFESAVADLKSSVGGVLEYQTMKLQTKEPWTFSMNVKRPDDLFRFLPITCTSIQGSVSPFKASWQGGLLLFQKDPILKLDILGIHDHQIVTMDCASTVRFNSETREWMGSFQATDAQKHTLASLECKVLPTFGCDFRLQAQPEIVPFLNLTPLFSYFPFYQGLNTARVEGTIENLSSPYANAKMMADLVTDRIKVSSHLFIKDGTVEIGSYTKKPLLSVRVDNDMVDFLKKNNLVTKDLELSSPCDITIPASTCKSRFENSRLTSLIGDLSIHLDELRLKIQGKKYVILPLNLALHLEKKKLACTLTSTSEIGFETKTSLSGDCTVLYTGALDELSLDKMTVEGSLELKEIPSHLIQLFAPKAVIANEFLAPTFSLSSHFRSDKLKSGEAEFHVRSPHLVCDLHSSTIKNGALTFTSPLMATFKVDRKGSEALFKKLSPYICSAIDEDHEIKLSIAPQGTSIPLSNFSVQTLSLPSIILEIGKVKVRSSGVLKTLMHILHPKASKTTDLWCTNVHASLVGGLFTLQRFDLMAADLIHVFAWGTADIPKNAISMKIAIPRETFENMRLYLSLPRPVTMSISGKLDSPSIDVARLTTRLAGASASTYGAATGALELLGGALQLASTVGEDDTEIPAPLETPFPWERR